MEAKLAALQKSANADIEALKAIQRGASPMMSCWGTKAADSRPGDLISRLHTQTSRRTTMRDSNSPSRETRTTWS